MIPYLDASALVKRYVAEPGSREVIDLTTAAGVATVLVSRAEVAAAFGQDVVLATFDRQLWEVAPRVGLQAWPETPPGKAR